MKAKIIFEFEIEDGVFGDMEKVNELTKKLWDDFAHVPPEYTMNEIRISDVKK